MASKYLTLDCFTARCTLLSVMNLTVFLPFNINRTEECKALYMTQRHNTEQTSAL